MADDRTLRVGLLGAGFMGRKHGQNLLEVPGVEIAGVCAQTVESARRLAEELKAGLATTDFGELLEAGLDAMYVCLPPDAHSGEVEAAADRGVHLFLEKPLALTIERAASMVEAIASAGVVSQVGYHQRFGSAVRLLKSMIADGSAGAPTLFQARYFANARHKDWWRDVTRSGGQVFEQAIHQYDLALHLLGEPAIVTGFIDNLCHRDQPDYTVDDTSVSAIRFRSGALASIVGSNCAIPTQWIGDCRVVCQNVTVEFTDPNDAVFTFSEGRPAEEYFRTGQVPQSRHHVEPVDVYLEETRNFIAAIRGQAPALAPADEGLTGVRLVAAVLQSAYANGQPIRL